MSDVFDRNIVLFIFLIVFFYMQFLSIQARTRTNWNNLTCNPLVLFTNSIFQSEEDANKNFKKCVVELSTETTNRMLDEEIKTQQEVLTNLSGITTQYTDLTSAIGDYKKKIVDTSREYTDKVADIKNSQELVKTSNTDTTRTVTGYLSQLQTIFHNIESYFKK